MAKVLSSDAVGAVFAEVITMLCNVVDSYYYAGRVEEAVALIEQSLHLAEMVDVRDADKAALLVQYGKTLTNATFRAHFGKSLDGDAFASVTSFETAQQALLRAKLIAEGGQAMAQIADANNALGMNHYIQRLLAGRGDHTVALGYFNEAYQQYQILGDFRGMAETLFSIGLIYQNLLERDDQAEVYYRQGLEIANQHELWFEKSYLVRHLGYLIFRRGEREEGLQYAQESLALREALGATVLISNSHMLVADLCLEMQDMARAKDHYQQALTVAEQINDPANIERASQKLAGVAVT